MDLENTSPKTAQAEGPEDHRRKWDVEKYERLAVNRLEAEEKDANGISSQSPPKRSLLKPREFKLNLESRVGQSTIAQKDGTISGNNSLGFYCQVCDCVVKDSINYLDHVNGKKHQRYMGMSMKIERSSLEQVKQRFDRNKKKLAETRKEYDLTESLKGFEEEETRVKEQRKERRRERKRKLDSSSCEQGDWDDAEDKLMLSTMGFSGFGSYKS